MKKSVLSGLITGVLTIVTAYAAPSASAEETTDESTQTYETDAIVITASRSETTISDVPADVTLISGEQIERGNYTSVSDALKGANINVVQKGFASYPVINGDSRVLVMVDGKKVNWDHLMVSGDSNAVDVDQIPIGNVERIEIVRGPNSSLYGERAVSGVINIITKRPTGGTPAAHSAHSSARGARSARASASAAAMGRTASRSASHTNAAMISSIKTPMVRSELSGTATSSARTTTSALTASSAATACGSSSAAMKETTATASI